MGQSRKQKVIQSLKKKKISKLNKNKYPKIQNDINISEECDVKIALSTTSKEKEHLQISINAMAKEVFPEVDEVAKKESDVAKIVPQVTNQSVVMLTRSSGSIIDNSSGTSGSKQVDIVELSIPMGEIFEVTYAKVADNYLTELNDSEKKNLSAQSPTIVEEIATSPENCAVLAEAIDDTVSYVVARIPTFAEDVEKPIPLGNSWENIRITQQEAIIIEYKLSIKNLNIKISNRDKELEKSQKIIHNLKNMLDKAYKKIKESDDIILMDKKIHIRDIDRSNIIIQSLKNKIVKETNAEKYKFVNDEAIKKIVTKICKDNSFGYICEQNLNKCITTEFKKGEKAALNSKIGDIQNEQCSMNNVSQNSKNKIQEVQEKIQNESADQVESIKDNSKNGCRDKKYKGSRGQGDSMEDTREINDRNQIDNKQFEVSKYLNEQPKSPVKEHGNPDEHRSIFKSPEDHIDDAKGKLKQPDKQLKNSEEKLKNPDKQLKNSEEILSGITNSNKLFENTEQKLNGSIVCQDILNNKHNNNKEKQFEDTKLSCPSQKNADEQNNIFKKPEYISPNNQNLNEEHNKSIKMNSNDKTCIDTKALTINELTAENKCDHEYATSVEEEYYPRSVFTIDTGNLTRKQIDALIMLEIIPPRKTINRNTQCGENQDTGS